VIKLLNIIKKKNVLEARTIAHTKLEEILIDIGIYETQLREQLIRTTECRSLYMGQE